MYGKGKDQFINLQRVTGGGRRGARRGDDWTFGIWDLGLGFGFGIWDLDFILNPVSIRSESSNVI